MMQLKEAKFDQGMGLPATQLDSKMYMYVFQSGSTLVPKDVRRFPNLTKILVSARELDDAGYTCTFGSNLWKISKGALSIAREPKTSTLYVLHVSKFSNHVICVAEQPSVSLWHRRLGRLSKFGMQVLSHSGYISGLNFSDFSVCEHCLYGKQAMNSHSIVS